jgi:hypothetical protein
MTESNFIGGNEIKIKALQVYILFFSAAFPGLLIERKNFEIYIGGIEKNA